jgi:2-polyprenyl-3-methyl-5-hydroxy-6-metoxy-1,4-benzoquinol methylase
MPTIYTEPFGGVAVEAMMCGTPVVTTDYGVFPETIEHGKTGFRCHTLGDFITGILAAETLDRKYIADRARRLYSTNAVGKMYDTVFKQIYDLKDKGWYTTHSHYIEEPKLIWEQRWWGDCIDTKGEEEKQKVYAKYMGLGVDNDKFYFNPPYAMQQKIIDIGGGPVSMLLKMADQEFKFSKVYDPSTYPEWTIKRYQDNGIAYVKAGGEEVNETGYDEVWIYNCLQHTENPELIIQNAKKAGKRLRIFEWLDTPQEIGHPQMITQENLEKWIGKKGNVSYINENGATGKAFYGVFEFKN